MELCSSASLILPSNSSGDDGFLATVLSIKTIAHPNNGYAIILTPIAMPHKRKYTEADLESSSGPALDAGSNRNLDADEINTSTKRSHRSPAPETSDSEPVDIDFDTDSTESDPGSSDEEELPSPPPAKDTDDETGGREEKESRDNAEEVLFNTILNQMNEIFDKSPKPKRPATHGETKTVCWAENLTAVKPIPARGSMSWNWGAEGSGDDGDETESESDEE